MEKINVNTLRDLVEQAAAEYGDKTFLKEKAGKDIVEKSFNDMLRDTRKVSRYLLTENKDIVPVLSVMFTILAFLIVIAFAYRLNQLIHIVCLINKFHTINFHLF